jgi:hypothetical protein
MRRSSAAFIVVSAVALVLVAGSAASAGAAELSKLRLSPHHPSASWQGSASFDGAPSCATAESCDTVPVRLHRVNRRFLARAQRVLQVTIRWKTRPDTFTLELDNSGGSYVRSSAAATDALPKNPLIQRVAVRLKPGIHFPRKLQALVTPGQAEGGYRGKVKLMRERGRQLLPSAGFARKSLSLTAKGPLLGAGEPSLAFGPGAMFVTAPAASPAVAGSNPDTGESNKGVIYFRSADGGHHWASSNVGAELGGGDSDVVADSDATYLEDLALAPSTIFYFRSTNGGQSFDQMLPFTADADREWLASYVPKVGSAVVYTVYHGLANQEPILCASNDGGMTTLCQPGITDPQVQINAAGNTDQGNIVVEKDGDADFLFATSTPAENADPNAPAPGVGALHNLYVGHYDLGTGTITDYPVYLGPTGHWITGLFPVLAIDRSGNLYASWPESPSDAAKAAAGPWKLKFSHSTDSGQTWSKPDVMNPPKLHNNLLNWVTAGSRGKVDIIWAGSTSRTNQYDSRARWYMFFAQSRNALAKHPKFSYRQITPHPIRYGNVCVLGLFCPSDDSRGLLDFAQVEVDRTCRAHVVYGDSSLYIPGLLRKNQIFRGDGTGTDYARQGRRGFRLCQDRRGGAGGAGSYVK